MDYDVKEPYDCQLLYFTSSSCLQGEKGIVFIGEEKGNPNVYYKNFPTGSVARLSDNQEGVLKSYVYFNGNENGLGKASVCLDQSKEKVYYLQGRLLCCADLNGNIRVLNEIPQGQVTAFMHVSHDGSRLCVPTTDARALEDVHKPGPATLRPDYDIDARIQQEGLSSWLRVYNTESGEEVLCQQVPKAWITHVQFHPQNREWILYNHEWPSFCGIRRMWLWDGKCHRALRSIDQGRGIHDWVCHEMWSEEGRSVIYHGQYAGGRYFVGRIVPETGETAEIALPENYISYGHFTVSKDGLLVSDGYFREENSIAADSEGASGDSEARWISVQKPDWEKGTIRWIPVEKHNSSWKTQDEHPHPIFSPDGRRVYYTTDAAGRREVRSCRVPDSDCFDN